ncbi:histone-lysine N-methyltransferase NSD2 [Brachionichthys hirsutus]|uniref:histone-lysine N-methyltransferase NSD2 n=1 Tax=Brachionichthys hirsutus TaxID=412623 RepID=UPI00360484C9
MADWRDYGDAAAPHVIGSVILEGATWNGQPSMPEPANPISMKQPPDSHGRRKGGGGVSEAAVELTAALQDGVLQKMAGHSHERLKDLTSRVLNGDQDALPKLCAPEPPTLKGAPRTEPELNATIPQGVFEPCCANGGSSAAATEDASSVSEKLQDVKKRRGRSPKAKPRPNLCSPEAGAGAANESDLIEMAEEAPGKSPLPITFSVGELVWTKVSGFPWWPCMVTTDPECNSHFKQKPKASNSKPGLLYHVQYFGENPERGYTSEKNMVSFTTEHQYHELSQRNKRPAFRIVHTKTAPSVPRKLQAQWSAGVLQANEALGMSPGERVANFAFLYDGGGPHLNPHIMEKLKPQENNEVTDDDTESRLRPDRPLLLAAANNTELLQSKDRTSKGETAKVARPKLKKNDWQKRGNGHLNHSLSTDELNSTDGIHPQPAPQVRTAMITQHPSVVPPKKRRRPERPQSPTTNVRRRNKSASDCRAPEPVEKREWQRVPALEDASEAAPVKKAKRPKQKNPGTPAGDSSVKVEQKTTSKRRKISPAAPPPFLLNEDQEPEKPKPQKKRKRDGENRVVQKRPSSPCPDPEGSGSEGCPNSPGDSLDGIKKGERKKEFVCQVCEQAGEDLAPCEGQCCGMFHLHCLGLSFRPGDKLLCRACSTGIHSCFKCKRSEGALRRCHVPHCGKFYHEACLGVCPLAVFDNKGFRCPLHTCLGCYYGGRTKNKSTKGRLMRCLRCPVAYHTGDLCVAAGSEVISSTSIICTNHFSAKKACSRHRHVNVSWCFVCSRGGRLLCCESCPASFHPDCLNIAMPDGSWFCNDCRAGKKLKYRDIIWVKLGTYRWWPAEIHHPRNIPTNIQHLRHQIGEFPVFFFGSRDYFWTHQGRVFPYMEGDRGSNHQRTGIGKVFKNALLEAEARFKEIKVKREAREAQQNSRKPPPYKFIKVNKPVGKVQVNADTSEIPKCNCRAADERPCGFESECLNRMLQYECHPQVCPSGGRCCNQDFTQRLYPETKVIKTPGKGWGLVSLRDIKKGEFVNEYVGELIDEEECRARIKYAQDNNISDFYMLTIDKDRIIDAGPKGNYSRFMNHSCQPNCETQKWTVNGDTRVGLFAVCDVPLGTELTFNYNLDCLGNEKTVCRCGAPNCSGFLGDRPKNGHTAEPKGKRLKRKYRKRKAAGRKRSEDECFRCRDGGQLVLCNKKACTKAYHLSCLNLTKRPFGRWDCPWHHCDICGKNSAAFCQLCPNSFCKAHQEGALRPWPATGQLCCQEHEELDVTTSQDQDIDSNTNGCRLKGSRKAEAAESDTKGSKRKPAEV